MDKTLDEFKQWRKALERKQNERNRLEGKLESVMTSLKEQTGHNSIEEAEHLLEEKQADLEKSQKTLKKKMETFQKQYGELLND